MVRLLLAPKGQIVVPVKFIDGPFRIDLTKRRYRLAMGADDYRADRPGLSGDHERNVFWASDFTYVATRARLLYAAFVIDIHAPRIIG